MTPRNTGALLAAYYAGVVAFKTSQAETDSLLWLCHACLALGALALLLRMERLVRATAVCLIVPTLIWWLDAASLLIGGRLLVGAINPPTSAAEWLATSHHFFLAPLLLVVLPRIAPDRGETRLASVIVSLLIAGAFFAAPRHLNINWAHSVLPGVDLPAVHAWNAMAPIFRIPLTIVGALALIVVPGSVVLGALDRLKREAPLRTPRPAATR